MVSASICFAILLTEFLMHTFKGIIYFIWRVYRTDSIAFRKGVDSLTCPVLFRFEVGFLLHTNAVFVCIFLYKPSAILHGGFLLHVTRYFI